MPISHLFTTSLVFATATNLGPWDLALKWASTLVPVLVISCFSLWALSKVLHSKNDRLGVKKEGEPHRLELVDSLTLDKKTRLHLVRAGQSHVLVGCTTDAVSPVVVRLPTLPILPTPMATQEASPLGDQKELSPPAGEKPTIQNHAPSPQGTQNKMVGVCRRNLLGLLLPVVLLLTMATPVAHAAQMAGEHHLPPFPLWTVVFALAAVVPLLLLCLTSFIKLAIVLSLVRHALGTPDLPPTTVITGLSLLLTLWVMAPVGVDIWERAGPQMVEVVRGQEPLSAGLVAEAKEPMVKFLVRHTHREELDFFTGLSAQRQGMQPKPDKNGEPHLLTLAPAFVLSQLKEAFFIGFLIFIPFLVIDLIVANLIIALGLVGLSATAVALPFKLLLFVSCDGWVLLTQGLVAGYI